MARLVADGAFDAEFDAAARRWVRARLAAFGRSLRYPAAAACVAVAVIAVWLAVRPVDEVPNRAPYTSRCVAVDAPDGGAVCLLDAVVAP